MSATDCLVLFGPILVFALAMAALWGYDCYLANARGLR